MAGLSDGLATTGLGLTSAVVALGDGEGGWAAVGATAPHAHKNTTNVARPASLLILEG